MTIGRWQENPECHSGQHGDVVDIRERPGPDDQWECASDCSITSTTAVVSDNGPPPGHRAKEQTLNESSPDGELEDLCPDEHPAPAESTQSHALQGEADGAQTLNAAHLSALEGTSIIRHPTILTPGAISLQDGYRDEDHTVPTQINTYESPSTYHPADFDEKDDDGHLLIDSPTPYSASGFSEADNQQSSPFQPYRPFGQIIADGVEFDLISPPVYAPSPTASPVPTPSFSPPPNHDRSRSTSTSSRTRPSRSPSPAYGAWISDQPRPKRPSFLDRAQAHFERSIHEHLVKAGQRPLPSFKVLGVECSAKRNVGMCEDDGDESAHIPFPALSPSHAEADWRERMEGLMQASGRGSERSRTVSPDRSAEEQGANQSWKLSEEKEVGAENPHAAAPAHMSKYIDSMTEKHSIAGLHIDTNLKPLPPPPGVAELETPRRPIPEQPPLPQPSYDRFQAGAQEEDEDVKVSDSMASWPALEPLSLDPVNSGGMHHPANTYRGREIQRRRRQRRQQQQRQDPVTDPQQSPSRSRPPLRLEEHEPRAEAHTVRSPAAPLSRDQLGFASLPSPLEDLFRPFPFDNPP